MSLTQKGIGNCCSACSTSYVLERLAGMTFTRTQLIDLWEQVAFVPGKKRANLLSDMAGTPVPHPIAAAAAAKLEAVHGDPTKMAAYLRTKGLTATPYLKTGSPLAALGAFCAKSTDITAGDGFANLNEKGWAITIVNNGAGYHYVAIKKPGPSNYEMMDPNEDPPRLHRLSVANFHLSTVGQNWAPTNGLGCSYTYLGGTVVVHK